MCADPSCYCGFLQLDWRCRDRQQFPRKRRIGGPTEWAVTASRITPTVDGQASAYSWGTRALGTADDRSAYDMGGIDSTYIAAGYANKLICNEIASTPDTIMQPQYARVDLLTGATSYEIENICNIVLRYLS